MNKLLIYLLLCYCSSTALFANNIDSVLRVLEQPSTSTDKTVLKNTYQTLGNAYLETKEFQKALENFEKALSISLQFKSIAESITIQRQIATCYQNLHQPEAALTVLEKVLTDNAKQIQDTTQSKILAKCSMIHLSLGNTEKAYAYQLHALQHWEEVASPIEVANCNYQLGSIFFAQGKYEEALTQYQKSFAQYKAINNIEKSINCLAAIGSVYGRQGQFDLSLKQNFEALTLADSTGNKKSIAAVSHNISADYLSMGKTAEAEPFVKKALQLRRELGDKIGENHSLQALGYMNMLWGNYAKSVESLEKAVAIAKEVNEKALIRDSYGMLSNIHQGAGKWKMAFQTQQQFMSLKDSMMNESVNQKMMNQRIKYELDKKEKEKQIELLTKDKEIASLHRYVIVVGLLTLLVFFIVLLSFVWYRGQNQAKINQLLNARHEEIQLQNERLAHSNRDLEQFAYITSHDLKEPLRTIGSFTTLLDRKCRYYEDEDAKEYMTFINDAVQHMHNLLTDLLAYSRIGITTAEHDQVDLNKVLKRVQNTFYTQIENEGIQITQAPLPKVSANRIQMIQLFQNLIGNAIKFRSDQTPHIQIDYSENEKNYIFSVSDNGIGMEKEYTDKIFVIFQRLHNRTEYDGTGIGLSICKKIVEQHHGNIWVESQSNKGSTFYFSIPKIAVQIPDQSAIIAQQTVAQQQTPAHEKSIFATPLFSKFLNL